MTKRTFLFYGGILIGFRLIFLALPAAAQTIAEKAQVCSACHGENGVPTDPSIPVIWGQREGYIYIELRDFQRGARKNDLMAPIVANLSRDDMLALAEYFSRKPWPNLGQPSASASVAHQAETDVGSGQCPQCHLGGFLGDSTNPRLAGQRLDYLRHTMAAFRSGERGNNSWMTDLLRKFPDSDIDALAQYLAGL